MLMLHTTGRQHFHELTYKPLNPKSSYDSLYISELFDYIYKLISHIYKLPELRCRSITKSIS